MANDTVDLSGAYTTDQQEDEKEKTSKETAPKQGVAKADQGTAVDLSGHYTTKDEADKEKTEMLPAGELRAAPSAWESFKGAVKHPISYLSDVQQDVEQGGGRTIVGRALGHAQHGSMEDTGYTADQTPVASIMAGPIQGPPKVLRGGLRMAEDVKEHLVHPIESYKKSQAGEPSEFVGGLNEAAGGAFQTPGPLLGMSPTAIPRVVAGTLASKATGKGLGYIGVPEEYKELGENIAGGVAAGAPEIAESPITTQAVRRMGSAYQKALGIAPEIGAVTGAVAGMPEGPGGVAYGTYTGGKLGKIAQKVLPEGRAAAEFRMTPEEKAVHRLGIDAKKADVELRKAMDEHSKYAASEARGPIDPETNPAYKKSLETVRKAQEAAAEAHYHLQEAKLEMERVKGAPAEGTPVSPDQPLALTPEQQAVQAARPLPEDVRPAEKSAAEAGAEEAQRRMPGQVQPETFPQEPKEAPTVTEGATLPLAEGKGVRVGRPKLLTGDQGPVQLGLPLEEPKPEAPTPIGEILPPEKPAKPGRLGALRAEGGRIVDTEPEIQQRIEEGLQRGTAEAKPVALKPLGASEEKAPLGKIALPEEKPTEVPKVEAKEKPEEKLEMAPEDQPKVEAVLRDHTDQELVRLGNKYGLDESKYDFSARDEHRHRVERDQFVKDLLAKMPEKDQANIARLADDFDSKDTATWTAAERNAMSRAQRARAIMQEHTGGIKPVGGGAPETPAGVVERGPEESDEERIRRLGYVPEDMEKAKVGTEKGAKEDTAFFEQAKRELPNASLSEQLGRAQELKTKGALPIPEKPEDLKVATENPFKVLGQETPKAEAAPEPKINPKPTEPRPAIDRAKVAGGDVAEPHTNYHEASQKEGNPWVRRSADPANDSMPTNEKRTLLVQFASDLLQKESMNDAAKAYYDKLYSGAREGYARMRDFWETPQWMGFASHMMPDADVYVVRDMESAKNFLNSAKYGHVAFSALDVNVPFIQELAKSYDGSFDVGGYAKPERLMEGVDNIRWHDDMKSFAKEMGVEYKNGVDYRHFQGSDVIPRLTLSDGCLHKCAFCIVPRQIKMTPDAVITQQADAIADMGSKLVYLNDKTFGQAPNHSMLPDLYTRMKERNPDFQGFVVQTTAAQMNKLTPEFLKKSGIKFVELGVETYNDALLKELHKPATESLVDKAMSKLKDAGIAAIPNIIIGLPGEDAATYAHTLEFLKKNADNISHSNIYNLAIYKDAELGQKLAVGADGDLDENVLHKSFHTDPQVHATFAGDLYGLGQELLEKKVGEPLPSDLDKQIAQAHNESEIPKGTSFHPVEGSLVGKEGYSVGLEKSLEKKVEGTTLKPSDITEYRNRPEVKAALEKDPKLFVGTWEHKGNVYIDVSKFEPDLEKAKAAARENGQKAIYDLKGKKEIEIKPKTPAEMTEEEFAAKAIKEGGVSGGAPGKAEKKLPTGDELIKKYGEAPKDPAHVAFILPDGRGVAYTGQIHDEMLGGKATEDNPPRERFIAQGNIRVNRRTGMGGRETALSIPESGITPGQLKFIKDMGPQLRSGAVRIEVGKPGGDYRVLDYGHATDENLEKTLRDLAPVRPEGYPKGTPTVSGGAPSAAAAEAKEGVKLPELAEKHLTPEEKAGVLKSKAQTEKFVQRMEEIPEVHEYRDIALAGEGARKWYQRSTKAFDALMEEAPDYFKEGDRDKFINLLAASSPRQSVAMNLRETLRTWKAYVDAGRPEGEALESLLKENLTPATSKVPNALKALKGEEMWPDITKNKNFKVPSFGNNLRGWLNSVTSDGWMSLFAGLDPREISSAHSYHPLAVATRAAAEELGWEPAEAQAAIWSFTQALTERGEELPEEVRKHSEDFVDLLKNDPEVRGLLEDLGVSHENLDRKLEAIGEKPEVSGRTTSTTSRSVVRLRERIEKARGEGRIPPPKSAQGELFREAPAHESRSRLEDEDVSFRPEEFGPKKKYPLGKIKTK